METPSIETSPAAPSTVIAEYSLKEAALQEIGKVGAGLAELKKLYSCKVYEVTTTVGMDQAKAARADIREKRYKIPKIVDAKKAELKKIAKDIESEGDRIMEILYELESPIHKQIKDEEERKEAIKAEKARIEQERIAGIRTRIDKIKGLPLMAVNFTYAELTVFISQVDSQPIGIEFEEFAEEATAAKAEVIITLNQMQTAKQTAEAEVARIKAEHEAEAARLEEERSRLEAECLERERIEAEEREHIRKEQEQEAERLAALKAENDRIAAEQADALKLEREAFEKQQEAARKLLAEQEEKNRVEEAERQRIANENMERETTRLNAERADLERQQVELDESKRQKEEAEVAEKLRIETEAEAASLATMETVTILKSEYEQLLADSKLLNALRNAGVDNWDGYDFALEAA